MATINSDKQNTEWWYPNSVLSEADGQFYALAYNLDFKRWDLWDVSSVGCTGTVIGKKGEVFFSDGVNLRQLCGSAGSKSWHWHSKDMTFGNESQLKRFIYSLVNLEANGTLAVDGLSTSVSASTAISMLIDGDQATLQNDSGKYRISVRAERKGYICMIRLHNMKGTDEVNSIKVIARPLKH